MTKPNLREELHQFAIAYRPESKETREEDIDQIMQEFTQALEGEKDKSFIRGVRLACALVQPYLSQKDFEQIIKDIDSANVDQLIEKLEKYQLRQSEEQITGGCGGRGHPGPSGQGIGDYESERSE